MHRRSEKAYGMLIAVLAGLISVIFTGCEIEETPPVATGSVDVSLADTNGNAIAGALIRIDGRDTPRYSPAILKNVIVGRHTISAFKPGFQDTSISVDVRLNETVAADLVTIPAESGIIELVGAPNGTVLILNTIPVGSIPATPEYPNLFERLGIGIFQASAYLRGYATELPAKWTVQLSSDATVPLMPLFSSVPTAAEIGSLSPEFELPSDWDSSFYRLQDYRGQVLLVTFYFNNCAACIEEFPYIAAAYKDPQFSGKVQIIGINFVDSYRDFTRFRDVHSALDISFPLLHDGQQQARQAYGISTCPANFIVDATGRIRHISGSISEPLLRQELHQLVEQTSASTFRFTMQDTLISYDDGNRSFAFHGRLENLLAARRTFVIALESVVFPDSERNVSICTYRGCDAPTPGAYILHETYYPLQIDTFLSFDIYNTVTEMYIDSPITGNYVMRITIYPADNASEVVSYNLLLKDMRSSTFVWRRNPRLPDSVFENK